MSKVFILGTNGVKNWPEEEGEKWSFNGLHALIPEGKQPSRWFQIHRPEDLYKESPEHMEWLQQEHPFPIYMNHPEFKFPSAVEFPFLKCLLNWPSMELGSAKVSSSFSWAVAMAMHLNFTEIALHGVNLSSPRENWLEAPNLMLWLGIAAAKGIKITWGPDSRFDTPMLYGYEERQIPAWAPLDVVKDMIVDRYFLTRRLLGDWYELKNFKDSV